MSELDLGRLGYGAANIGNLYRALSDEEAWQILETAWLRPPTYNMTKAGRGPA